MLKHDSASGKLDLVKRTLITPHLGRRGVPRIQAVRLHPVRISAPQSAMETPRLNKLHLPSGAQGLQVSLGLQ